MPGQDHNHDGRVDRKDAVEEEYLYYGPDSGDRFPMRPKKQKTFWLNEWMESKPKETQRRLVLWTWVLAGILILLALLSFHT